MSLNEDDKRYVKELLESSNKVLPQLKKMLSHGAERALMSVLITSPDDFFQIRSYVHKEDLTSQIHRKFYEVVCNVSDKLNNGGYVTPEQILYENEFNEDLKKLGIPDYIQALTKAPYNKKSTYSLIKIIKSKRIQRELWHNNCERIQQLLEFDGEDISDLINIVELPIYDLVRDHSLDSGIFKFGNETEGRLLARENTPSDISGYRFSLYPAFTHIINGACNGELIVGAGRMKSGKSVFLNNLAVNLSIWGDKEHYTGDNLIPSGYIDSEMELDLQEDRSLSSLSGVEQRKITNGLFAISPEDRKRVYEAKDWMQKGELYWTRIREFNTRQVIFTFKRLIKEHGVKVCFFDQIKDTTDVSKNKMLNTKQRVAWLAHSLKSLAEDMNVPVIAATQLNRSGDMDNLRTEWLDPSLAFADADEVLRFCNKGFYLSEMPSKEIESRGGIGKCGDRVLNLFINRNGDVHDRKGGIGYFFKKRNTRFEELGDLD